MKKQLLGFMLLAVMSASITKTKAETPLRPTSIKCDIIFDNYGHVSYSPYSLRVGGDSLTVYNELSSKRLKEKGSSFSFKYFTDNGEERDLRFIVSTHEIENGEVLSYTTQIESISLDGRGPTKSISTLSHGDDNNAIKLELGNNRRVHLTCVRE